MGNHATSAPPEIRFRMCNHAKLGGDMTDETKEDIPPRTQTQPMHERYHWTAKRLILEGADPAKVIGLLRAAYKSIKTEYA